MRVCTPRARLSVADLAALPGSESNFTMCFLLEIPLMGFPFQTNSFQTTEYIKTTHILFFKGFHVKRKSPQGDLKQETCRKYPALLASWPAVAWLPPPGSLTWLSH